MAFASYRLILYRFASSPGAVDTIAAADALMQQYGFDTGDTSVDYESGSTAANTFLAA